MYDRRTVLAEEVSDSLVAQFRELRESVLEADAGHHGVEAFDEGLETTGRLRTNGRTVEFV